MNKKAYAGIDYFRIIAALLIVAIHTYPLLSFGRKADFVFTHVLARTAVPFFFMATGFFMLPRYLEEESKRKEIFGSFMKKTGLLYGGAILLYLPVNIYSGGFGGKSSFFQLVKDLIFNGTFYHLWYLPASMLGTAIVFLLGSKLDMKALLGLTLLLYIAALLGDSYYGITRQSGFLKGLYDVFFIFFDYTRNGFFMAPVFIALGGAIARRESRQPLVIHLAGLTVSLVLLVIEGILVKNFDLQRHDSMYIMLVPCMYFLFRSLLLWRGGAGKSLRKLSMLIYILHPMCIIIIRGFAKFADMTALLIDNSLWHYIAVVITTIVLALGILAIRDKNGKKPVTVRAWAEIDLKNLGHNINEFRRLLPESCKIMAVVKANAYGHGDAAISKELNRLGVNAFAVATAEEGIRLRKNGVGGEILILGYTFPEEIYRLVRYDLTQTVVNHEYAVLLNRYEMKIKVHVKIDTGMHRLGESCEDLQNIYRIFQCGNLLVTGTYTHLSVSDSLEAGDVEFTNKQIDSFYKTVGRLEEAGFAPGKIHIQSSYGVLNYPYLKCDYARLGIAMYGVLSNSNDRTRISAGLKPVLSLKARVVLTKEIAENEPVGYGRNFTAGKSTKIAVIAAGYADGIPRSLSGKQGYVLIKGQKAEIIGKVCMDQLMADVTHIPDIHQGDVAVLVGRDGTGYIPAEDVAYKAGTLTNEFLSRLGPRLSKNYLTNRYSLPEKLDILLKSFAKSLKFSINSSQIFSIMRRH